MTLQTYDSDLKYVSSQQHEMLFAKYQFKLY